MKAKFNVQWFREKTAPRGITQRKVAAHLNIDPGSLSKLLHGQRDLHLEEAVLLAQLLESPIEEVIKNSGISVPGEVPSDRLIISGFVDSNLNIKLGAPRGPKSVPVPLFGGKDLQVLRFQTIGTQLEGMDGTLVYYRVSHSTSHDCLSRLCVVEIEGKRDLKLRVVKRAYEEGSFNLTSMVGDILEEEAVLHACSPVLWMKF